MNKWLILVLDFLILGLFLFILYFWRLIGKGKSKQKKIYRSMFLYGMAGWTAAFLIRIIPLQLFQSLSLFLLGADLSDPTSVQALANKPLVQMWGPLFAGIFEGGTRFICFKVYKKSKQDPQNNPFFLGLGWSTAEILLIYSLNFVQIGNLLFTDTLIGLLERMIVTFAHIVFSYYAFYALYEKKWKKLSLVLSIFWHVLLDSSIIVWSIIFSDLANTSPSVFIYTLEGVFVFITLLAWLFGYFVWSPYKKKKILKQKEAKELHFESESQVKTGINTSEK